MQSSIAAKLGRPDLSGVVLDRYSGTSGGLQTGLGVTAGGSSANFEGRLTAGVALVALAAVVGFYIWTRDIQA
jgi:hypothetical protein